MTKNNARLTVEDLALVIQTEFEIPRETRDRLARWILAAAPFPAQLRVLARQTRDAGLDPTTPEGIWAGYCSNQEFDRLAGAGWTHPAEVLDPEEERVEIAYPELIAIAEARAGRAEGAEREKLRAIAARLRAAQEHDLDIQRLAARLRELPPSASRRLVRMARSALAEIG